MKTKQIMESVGLSHNCFNRDCEFCGMKNCECACHVFDEMETKNKVIKHDTKI